MPDTSKTELAPCPFCGGDAVFMIQEVLGTPYVHGIKGYSIRCETEGCIMEPGSYFQYESKETATKKWNTRSKRDDT